MLVITATFAAFATFASEPITHEDIRHAAHEAVEFAPDAGRIGKALTMIGLDMEDAVELGKDTALEALEHFDTETYFRIISEALQHRLIGTEDQVDDETEDRRRMLKSTLDELEALHKDVHYRRREFFSLTTIAVISTIGAAVGATGLG